jgi:hypothetical protein
MHAPGVNEPRSRYLRALLHGDVDAEGSPFVGAGVFIVKYGTEQVTAMRDGMLLSWSGRCSCSRTSRCPHSHTPSGFQIIVGSYAAAASWWSW